MENIISVVHILAAAGLIGLVLLQHGKGADMSAAFGSGASGSLFGVSGSTNFLSRATSMCVAVFFATSLALAYYASNRSVGASVVKVPVSAEAMVNEAVESDATTPLLPELAPAPASNTTDDIPN